MMAPTDAVVPAAGTLCSGRHAVRVYEGSPETGVRLASRVMKETGCAAVSRGRRGRGDDPFEARGESVIGHVGLTTRRSTLRRLWRRGREKSGQKILADARGRQGRRFSIVAKACSGHRQQGDQSVAAPSSASAPRECDGQVMVPRYARPVERTPGLSNVRRLGDRSASGGRLRRRGRSRASDADQHVREEGS